MSIEKLKKALSGNIDNYRAIPFWSWNNGLEISELLKQIENMKAVGMGGFIMHARTGLKDEYLGEHWFDCVSACLEKARELNMNAWIYDENGWPSGFVGGKLLENNDYRAQFLEFSKEENFDKSAFSVFIKRDGNFVRIQSECEHQGEYYNIYLRTSPANTDILNPEVVDAFIRETHEKYYERFKESFGRELTGFFTDEPQYYRWGTPYTKCAKEVFEKRYNEDIRDGLIYLFVKDEKGYPFREKYYRTLNELYVNNYYKKLYDWCTDHHCKLTGHSVEEPCLFTQMWGGAGCMPTYEYEHIPGVDCLCRITGSETAPKQVGSVASQMGIKQVLTETFGCSGYDATPYELKSIGDFQFFNGVNLMCHHLYPYSLAGQGKVDHPPVFSCHSNWNEGFREFNDYFTKLGYIVANTKENYDVLIIHPMRDIYLNYIRSEDVASVADCEERFSNLVMTLRKKGILYQYADESILARHGKISGDKLCIGENTYDKVVLPYMENISSETLELLKNYKGKLLTYNTPKYVDGVRKQVDLKGNLTESEIENQSFVKFYCEDGKSGITSRSGDIGDFIFIKNYSKDEPSSVKMQGVAENYKKIDLSTFELSSISNNYNLEKGEGVVLIRDESAKPKESEFSEINITDNFKVSDITENYFVSDFASYSFDGKKYSENLPLPGLFEILLRENYKGRLYIKHSFESKIAKDVKLIMEKGSLLTATLNGEKIEFSQNDFDVNFVESEVTIKKGDNQFIYSLDYYQHDGVHFALFDPLATESLRNCLYYDTHIENIYIKGDFLVKKNDGGGYYIDERKELPPITSLLCEKGYPFFKGNIKLKGVYNYSGDGRAVLKLDGRFMMAKIEINGKKLVAISDKKDITSLLKKGENSIDVTLNSSLRNLFGPHHFKPEPEPMGVSPMNFTMRTTWNNGESAYYTPKYNSVPFGISKISVIIEK